jgi:DNA-binding NarL/FixJ family response regulator
VRPDLLVLDLLMPRMTGLEALRELTERGDTVPAILLAGAIDRTQLLAAVSLGVRGLMLKETTTELLFEAMMRVMSGQCWLGQTLVADVIAAVRPVIQSSTAEHHRESGFTPREREVLKLVVAGHANKEIARRCAISEETIKHHLTRMFDKAGVSNRAELATRAMSIVQVDY